jgi:hypothetical protein
MPALQTSGQHDTPTYELPGSTEAQRGIRRQIGRRLIGIRIPKYELLIVRSPVGAHVRDGKCGTASYPLRMKRYSN